MMLWHSLGEWRALRAWRRELRQQAALAVQPMGLRWWRAPRRWLGERRRRRLFIETGVRLERLRRRALRATDDEARAAVIAAVGTLLGGLEARGAVTTQERIELGRDWLRAWARDGIGECFRERDALGVATMTFFLKAG